MVVNYHQQTRYILNHIGDEDSNVDDREYVAFLNMWLKRFIFCGSSCGPSYNHKYLAECLAARNEIPLGKYLLGSVYHLMYQVAAQMLKGEPVHNISGPLWLIQLWLNLYMHKIVRPDLRNLSFPSTNFAEGEEGLIHQCMNYGEAASAVSIAIDIGHLFKKFYRGFDADILT
jgi:hypothetical protein